jgi:4,5-DOPA dioxygenase extradiol
MVKLTRTRNGTVTRENKRPVCHVGFRFDHYNTGYEGTIEHPEKLAIKRHHYANRLINMMNIKDLHKSADSFTNTERMPVLFIGHGSPMNAIEENEFVAGWRKLGHELPKPQAILCISAHWETKGTRVTAMEKPVTIHDFGGFPRELYEVQYPAPGSPELADLARKLVVSTEVNRDEKWGLDHGCWSIVRRLYPAADIPVVQMSLDYYQTPQNHFALAKDLASLRKKGVLIIGSGNMVHNLRLVDWQKINVADYGFNWAIEASEKMKKYLVNDDFSQLINFRSQGSDFDLAIPTPEHFLPLLYSVALKEKDETISIFNDKALGGSLTMTSIKIDKS